MRVIMVMVAAVLSSSAWAQEAGTAAAPVPRPACGGQQRDSCQQTPAQERKAITAEQAEARDARHDGEWSPNHQRRHRKARGPAVGG